ncbi:MAG: efflux RND transporter periplasmic adaptor subunit, partial [Candidatus Hinthialibacter sp.]
GLSAELNVDAYPDKTFKGRVTRIAPILDPDTRAAEAEVEFENPDLLLKPGMFARVTIQFNLHENVLLVPNEAIVKRESKQGVFVVGPDLKTARFVSIERGIMNSEVSEVTGLTPEQTVIVMGQHLLSDGDLITVNESSAP